MCVCARAASLQLLPTPCSPQQPSQQPTSPCPRLQTYWGCTREQSFHPHPSSLLLRPQREEIEGALWLLRWAAASDLPLGCHSCLESGPGFCTYPNTPGFLRVNSNASTTWTETDSSHLSLTLFTVPGLLG